MMIPKISVPLEMIFVEYYSNDVDTVWLATERPLDPEDYGGISCISKAWFEATAAPSSEDDQYIQLVDEDGTLYATLEVPHYPLGTPTGKRPRVRVEFTPAATAKSYFVKTAMGPSATYSCDLDFTEVRIILDLVDTPKVRIQLPLVSSFESFPGCADHDDPGDIENAQFYAWCAFTTKTSDYGYYGYSPATGGQTIFRRFKKEESKFVTLDHWELEVCAGMAEVSKGYAALFNATTNQMVAGSEIEFNESENPAPAALLSKTGWDDASYPIFKTISIANNAANFTDGDEFEIRIKMGTGGGSQNWFVLYSACLYAHVVNAANCLVYWRCGNHNGGTYYGYDAYDSSIRNLYEPSKFSTLNGVYLEVYGEGGGTNHDIYLNDCYNSDDSLAAVFCHTENAEVVDGDWLPDPLPVTAFESYEGGDYTLGTAAYIDLAAPAGPNKVRASSFNTSAIPVGAVISLIQGYLVIANTNQSMQWYVKANTMGSPTYVNNPAAVVLGDGTIIMSGPYTNSLGITAIPTYVDIYFTQSNNTASRYIIDEFSLWVSMGLDVPETLIDPPNSYAITRSGDLSDYLIENHRYLMHYIVPTSGDRFSNSDSYLIYDVAGVENAPSCDGVTASIDADTLEVTGTGSGSNATQWRVVRVADSQLMAAGTGTSPSFSFIGRYDKQYQLQFAGEDDVFSTEGCTFSFPAPTPTTPEEALQPINPKIILKWSDDGGFTWSNEHWRDVGRVGEYRKRVIWRRLGKARDRVFWLEFTDPCKIVYTACYLGMHMDPRG